MEQKLTKITIDIMIKVVRNLLKNLKTLIILKSNMRELCWGFRYYNTFKS